MKLGGNRPPGDNPLVFSISGTGSFTCHCMASFRTNKAAFLESSPVEFDEAEYYGVVYIMNLTPHHCFRKARRGFTLAR